VATRWDGAFYLDIARNGYGPVDVPFPKWPFFPAFPGLIRALSEVADPKVAIFVLNQLVFLVALAGVYRIAFRHGGRTVAGLSVWALALFPASFVFSMTYPSAIFLAASVWGFLLVEDRHDLMAGVLAAGVALVRPNGLVVALALVIAVRTWRRALVVAGPAVVAVIGWCIYSADRTGDPLVFLTSKSRWQEITFVGLFEGHVKWSAASPDRVVGVRRALSDSVTATGPGRCRPLRERVLPAVRRRRSDPGAVAGAGALRGVRPLDVRDGGVRLRRHALRARAVVLCFGVTGPRISRMSNAKTEDRGHPPMKARQCSRLRTRNT
jgi:hypothetical protein